MIEAAVHYSVVLVTCKDGVEARRIAEVLLEHRLAACVNMIPGVESIYRWQGKIVRSKETLLLIKSRKELFPAITKTVRKNHSYENPEIITLPVSLGSAAYLHWLKENTKSERRKK